MAEEKTKMETVKGECKLCGAEGVRTTFIHPNGQVQVLFNCSGSGSGCENAKEYAGSEDITQKEYDAIYSKAEAGLKRGEAPEVLEGLLMHTFRINKVLASDVIEAVPFWEGRKKGEFEEGGACPECNADLSGGLNAVSENETLYKGNSEYEEYPSLSGSLKFVCPECGRFLADNEEDADEHIGRSMKKANEIYTPDELPECAVIISDDTPEMERLRLLRGVEEGKYILYTQVDGEESVVYLKGAHIVNRTGVYAVLPSTWEKKEVD